MAERDFEAEVFEKIDGLMSLLTKIRDNVMEVAGVVKDKVKPALDNHEKRLDLQGDVVKAQNQLIWILHRRVMRIEEYMNMSGEDFINGKRPHIGITPEENAELEKVLLAMVGARPEEERSGE